MATYVLDTECYRDYFLLLIEDVDTGAVMGAEMFPGQPFPLRHLPPGTYITFNGKRYDELIIALALGGADNATLKAASDDIIIKRIPDFPKMRGMHPWEIRDKYGGVDMSGVDHIDLMEVAPGQCSLKAYAGRLHSKQLQDLPIDPSASISPLQRPVLVAYCKVDLADTKDLYVKLRPQLDLRVAMSNQYGIDLRSKSDAQIAEAVIKKDVERRVGCDIYRPRLSPDFRFQYHPPSFIGFMSQGMRLMLNIIVTTDFGLERNGSVEMPRALESMMVRIGNGVYKMGIGGLHSTEKTACHLAGNDWVIKDIDVKGYYPNLMLTQRVCPPAMGEDFLIVFQDLVTRREIAKVEKDINTDAGLKTATVSCFGKFGSMWSTLYHPEGLIHVTLTGQLSILMLIETLHLNGIEVISCNTDGIVVKCLKNHTELLGALIAAWEITTGLFMEETLYSAIYAKDVNNYIAIGVDGKVKQKGIYSFVGSKKSELEKNPTNAVCVDAVIAHLTGKGTIGEQIYACHDVRRFLTCRQVAGGAMYGGEYLGKAVRWAYAKGETKNITYKMNGNMVARSTGARPLMTMPDSLPDWIDYDWYEAEARAILHDIGAV